MPATPLTEDEIHILEFEQAWAARRGSKEAAIRAAFSISSARYYQKLFRIVERPEALAHDPQLVHRVIRLRDSRKLSRIARRFAA